MKRGKTTFDPKIFLAKVGEGKTISKYRKDQIVFSQGQVADAVFYIQQGKIKRNPPVAATLRAGG
jgi:CRP-like cAMP-binding protein